MTLSPDDLLDSEEKAQDLAIKIIDCLHESEDYSQGEEIVAISMTLIASCLASGMSHNFFKILLHGAEIEFLKNQGKYDA